MNFIISLGIKKLSSVQHSQQQSLAFCVDIPHLQSPVLYSTPPSVIITA